ncbi:oxygenase MpaB family protein [Gordonia aquimaris]|uniref:Oxygenase MpaB family protein n=1 Tax=Gordonia aquimaris TaxID=2984863 RepID=A0A9X3D8S2_9ACTN|nr:oxygenase MpaB family protein [Gordonia aquimaris]MCX2966782.1 oxygenase MpaB family protein [Gordonia aquimaris]
MATIDHYQHAHVADVRASRHRRRIRRTGDLVTGLGPTIAGANVIMQLANPRVGYGVVESRVDSGSAVKHPIKRSRTTGTFLAVALLGDDEDRRYVHDELKRVHDLVYSTAESPVRYSANDSRLQLWVAICLLKYFIDQYELLYGRLTVAEKERIIADARWLGTTLNVRPDQWPSSYRQLQEYWDDQLGDMAIDPPVRDLLQQLSDLSFLRHRFGTAGTVAHKVLGRPMNYLINAGLPPEFRDMMQWRWGPGDERLYARTLRVARALDPATGRLMRGMLFTYVLDMRLRRRLGLKVF